MMIRKIEAVAGLCALLCSLVTPSGAEPLGGNSGACCERHLPPSTASPPPPAAATAPPGSGRPGPPEVELFQVHGVRKVIPGGFISPRFTDDGKNLILTGKNHRGLWLSDLEGGGPVKITDDIMAGWRPVSSSRGEIVYRGAEVGEQGWMEYRISAYDPVSGRSRLIYRGLAEEIYPPLVSGDGTRVLFVADRRLKSLTLEGSPSPLEPGAKAGPEKRAVFADEGMIWAIEEGGRPELISGDREACGGEALSPDGLRVAYLHGDTDSIIVYDFASGEEVDLGPGSSLAWSPDSRHLFYNVTADDGSVITASDLFAARPDGSGRQRLAEGGGRIWFNPALSPSGDRLVCEDLVSGGIFLMELTLSGPDQEAVR